MFFGSTFEGHLMRAKSKTESKKLFKLQIFKKAHHRDKGSHVSGGKNSRTNKNQRVVEEDSNNTGKDQRINLSATSF